MNDKINEKHLGWMEHFDGGKNHYYFKREGDFITSLCGITKINKNGMEATPSSSQNNKCKKCEKQHGRIMQEGVINIRANGVII